MNGEGESRLKSGAQVSLTCG